MMMSIRTRTELAPMTTFFLLFILVMESEVAGEGGDGLIPDVSLGEI